jgi:hypothetical protein
MKPMKEMKAMKKAFLHDLHVLHALHVLLLGLSDTHQRACPILGVFCVAQV